MADFEKIDRAFSGSCACSNPGADPFMGASEAWTGKIESAPDEHSEHV